MTYMNQVLRYIAVAVAVSLMAGGAGGPRLWAEEPVFVSPGGDDVAAGTRAAPFRTLFRAQAAARELARNMSADVVVNLAPGDYRLDRTLAFTEADSGTNGFRVIYRSADGPGKARLLGSVPLKGWTLWHDGIWKIDLPPKTMFHTLYENGQRVHKARFPDLEYDPEFPTALGRYLVTVDGTPVYLFKKLEPTKEPAWLPVISMHGYHAHPSDFVTKGSKISQESAVAAANRLFCSMATTRYGNRPLLVTEYGQVFWNRYRYEEGLLIGAYAAFQDWDGLMAHASPVVPRIDSAIRPFWVGHDPVGRASQVVAGFAHLRRDVTPSPHYVEIPLQRAHVFDAVQHARALSADQARLSLLTGIGLAYPGKPLPSGLRSRKPDLRLPVFGTSETLVKEFFSEVIEGVEGDNPLTGAVSALKSAGVLSRTNRTDPAKGIYESDTGQLLLNAPSHQLRVITPRLEGACLDSQTASGPVRLGKLTIESTSVPGSVTAIAVDDRPLDESRRILLVYATDALNSGMTFSSPERETLVALGGLPVLLRTGQLKVTLTGRHAASLKVWALGLDGRRAEVVAAAAKGETLAVAVDTGRLKGVTPFFEMVAE